MTLSMPMPASSWPSSRPDGPEPMMATCVRTQEPRLSIAAGRARCAEPQRGGGRHHHLRQQQPFERPGGARALLLVHQRLVHAGKLRGVEARERDQHLGDRPGCCLCGMADEPPPPASAISLPSCAISAISWPNLPRLPVTSDSQPANSASVSRWLCHCGASPRPSLAASAVRTRRRLVAEFLQRAGGAAELHDQQPR